LAVKALLEAAEERAGAILVTRRPDLDRGADLLLSKETLSLSDFPPLQKQTGAALAA